MASTSFCCVSMRAMYTIWKQQTLVFFLTLGLVPETGPKIGSKQTNKPFVFISVTQLGLWREELTSLRASGECCWINGEVAFYIRCHSKWEMEDSLLSQQFNVVKGFYKITVCRILDSSTAYMFRKIHVIQVLHQWGFGGVQFSLEKVSFEPSRAFCCCETF